MAVVVKPKPEEWYILLAGLALNPAHLGTSAMDRGNVRAALLALVLATLGDGHDEPTGVEFINALAATFEIFIPAATRRPVGETARGRGVTPECTD
jgi:hypothetical protein